MEHKIFSKLNAFLIGVLPLAAVLTASLFWQAYCANSWFSLSIYTLISLTEICYVAALVVLERHGDISQKRLCLCVTIGAVSFFASVSGAYLLARFAYNGGSSFHFYAMAVAAIVYFLAWYLTLLIAFFRRQNAKTDRILSSATALVTVAATVLFLFIHPTSFGGYFGNERKGKASVMTWSAAQAYNLSDTFILEKAPDKDFVILNLTDIQLIDADFSDLDKTAQRTFALISRLVSAASPDLITVTGDIGCGYLKATKEIASFLDSFGIPWAPVFGNHDHEIHDCDSNQTADIYLESEHCLFQKGSADMGIGNYIINITENGKVVQSILMMDSHNKTTFTEDGKSFSGYDHVWQSQIDWYRWAVNGVQEYGNGNTVKSIVMTHIPLVQYAVAFDENWDAEACPDADSVDDIKNGYWKTDASYGICFEKISCAPVDNGFFNAIRELDSTKTYLCGHDHTNNYCTTYQGVCLTYSLKTGSGCYWNSALSGGTLLTLSENGTVSVTHLYDSDL